MSSNLTNRAAFKPWKQPPTLQSYLPRELSKRFHIASGCCAIPAHRSSNRRHRQLTISIHHDQQRLSSHSPLGLGSAPTRKKVTIPTLHAMHKRNEPIAVITAHDFPSSFVADEAGMDIVLVGDSLAMVALGMQDTSELTVDDMLLHCKSVSRGVRSAFVVRCGF